MLEFCIFKELKKTPDLYYKLFQNVLGALNGNDALADYVGVGLQKYIYF